MNKSRSNTTPKIVGSLFIAAIVLSGAYVFLFKDNYPGTSSNNSAPPADNINNNPPANPTASDSTSTTRYKNGNYTASTTYPIPESSNSIQIKVTLDGDVIKSVDTTHQLGATDNKSSRYTQDFDAAISGQIVGREIDGISLSRVGGASLTTEGFNTALAKIIQQAKS